MSGRPVFNNLEQFFSRYGDSRAATDLAAQFRSSLTSASGKQNPMSFGIVRDLYEQAISLLEKDVAARGFAEADLELQRGLYRELEGSLSSLGSGTRHHFAIVVPVADRPLMLGNFLESLIEQCRIFGYGDTEGFGKITAFVMDDSNDTSNSARIREIVHESTASGLRVHYVGPFEQSETVKRIPVDQQKALRGLIGNLGGKAIGHKGASVTRNIAYLYLHSRMHQFPQNTLVWFIDSDEELRIKVKSGEEFRDIPFINYFYWLDRIFASSDPEVLTGKVVGDPPVTPAVMINTFLEDVLAFLQSASVTRPDSPCIFHYDGFSEPVSGEYHDMPDLFGYRKKASPKEYCCSLAGDHKVKDCFEDFSHKANGFFSGLHITRTQLYVHERDSLKTGQARTVYTGNYVIRRSGLRYFLPFAALGLRMAGPTLGRILRQRLGGRFVSANLPILHKRTLSERFTDEFRSGITKGGESLDLSGEFVMQFWGDVMLFSVEELTGNGYPGRIDAMEIADTVKRTRDRIWGLYRRHQAEVAEKLSEVKKHLGNPGQWWNLRPETKGPVRSLLGFCSVAEGNFGPHSAALRKISEQIGEGLMTEKIIEGISFFPEEDRVWGEVLKNRAEEK